MAVTTTSTLAGPVAAYYEKRFLMRANMNFVYEQLGTPGRIPKNEGRNVLLSVIEILRTLLGRLFVVSTLTI